MKRHFERVIAGGEVVTPEGVVRADLGISQGRIEAIGSCFDGDEITDASGLLVLPGGVDAHCHIDQMTSSGARTADDFRTASVGAAFGGTTTLLAFAAQHRGQRLRDVVEEYKLRAAGKALVDYGFHLIVTDAQPLTIDEDIPALVEEGFPSIKIYLTYDALRLSDGAALEVMLAARRNGAMTLVHAESHDIIAWLTERMVGAGYTEPRHYPWARPVLAERDATHHAITLAELIDTPIVVVHVSSEEALEQIRWAQDRGMPIHAETCPQYLVLTAEDLDRPAHESVKFCCSPPARDVASQEALWAGMANGTVSLLSSDHSAFFLEGAEGKLRAGQSPAFTQVPFGIPGIEARLPLVFSEGVVAGRISLERFVDLVATTPARLYGLAGRKGAIAEGADADIVLWDPKLTRPLRSEELHDGLGYTPYEGRQVTGWPVSTFVRGIPIVQDGAVVAPEGHGALLARLRPEAANLTFPPRKRFDPLQNRLVGSTSM